MTQEEKAKAYDEALEKAKEMMDNCSFETTKVVCQELFPELVESEDERIRRTLLEYFGPDVQLDFVRGVAIKKIRDWLEKQKEQKPAEYLDTDNMKPRVKISGRSYGEWEPGDTGVVDGYCRGENDIPYAIVILDRNFRFVMVDIEHLELIG